MGAWSRRHGKVEQKVHDLCCQAEPDHTAENKVKTIFERIAIDFLGPFSTTSNNSKYIPVVMDYLLQPSSQKPTQYQCKRLLGWHKFLSIILYADLECDWNHILIKEVILNQGCFKNSAACCVLQRQARPP